MLWPLVSIAGFVLATVLVIVLARSRTARWERERRPPDVTARAGPPAPRPGPR